MVRYAVVWVGQALTCALWSGARVSFLPHFDAREVWQRFVSHATSDPLTLFMGVPTMYARLISEYDASSAAQQHAMTHACKQFRVMVSGSAALPVPILNRWKQISGHTLLERYGMSELGMALSNPLHGERRPGYVGKPLPFVQTKVVIDADHQSDGQKVGQLLVKGPTVFSEYWNKPQATADTFDADGWFLTGDIVSVDEKGMSCPLYFFLSCLLLLCSALALRCAGDYRITGRASVDILKSGGYKISALDVEHILLEHPSIAECAVVGTDDLAYGQIVSAIIAVKVR